MQKITVHRIMERHAQIIVPLPKITQMRHATAPLPVAGIVAIRDYKPVKQLAHQQIPDGIMETHGYWIITPAMIQTIITSAFVPPIGLII